jgi:hypothetical protein
MMSPRDAHKSAALVGLVCIVLAASPQRDSASDSSRAKPIPPPDIVRIDVDALSPAVNPPDSISTALHLSEDSSTPAPWTRWVENSAGFLASRTAYENAPVVAVRTPTGVTLLVANRTEEPIKLRVAVKVGRGVHTLDSLSCDPKMPNSCQVPVRSQARILGKPGFLAVTLECAPGKVAAVNVTNRIATAQAARRELGTAMMALKASYPAEDRRIRVPLNECDSHLGAVLSGIRPESAGMAIRHIQRSILTLAHAQMLCRNSMGLKRVSQQSGEPVRIALDKLDSAMAELSAATLGLTPNVAISNAQSETNPSRTLTISLVNQGSTPIESVRLGAASPPATKVQPSDEAVFTSLKPGQTVTATFTVQLGEMAATALLGGDIAFVAARVPARLRVRPL